MKALEVCVACHCYVNCAEPRCPFCGAVARRRVLPRFAPRMSRGRWAALSSTLALVSCTDNGTPSSSSVPDPTGVDAAADAARDGEAADGEAGGSDADARSVDINEDRLFDARTDAHQDVGGDDELDGSIDASRDAIDELELDARLDSGTRDAGDADKRDAGDGNIDVSLDGGPIPADASDDADGDDGFFACNCQQDAACLLCSRRTQVCSRGHGSISCETYDAGALGEFPAQCMPAPSCACVGPYLPWLCFCSEMNGNLFVSCSGCYGCPPARYEKEPTFHAAA